MRLMSFPYEKLLVANWAIDRKVYDLANTAGSTPLKYFIRALAESWETPDNLTISIHVRKGVKWQDVPPVSGREFTADDVAWNYQRYMAAATTQKEYLQYIATATALDKYTVELKLKPGSRAGVVGGILDHQGGFYYAKETVAANNQLTDWHKAIGTGPFMLTDLVLGSALHYKRNPNYWGYDEKNPKYQLPYADGVKALIIQDISTYLAALRSGKLDVIQDVSWNDAASLKKTNPELLQRSATGTRGWAFKMRMDNKPFTDVRVRQAMQMAIDRETIGKTLYGGFYYPYTSDVTPNNPEYIPFDQLPDKPMWTTLSVKEVLSYNPQKAKQLLAEAGYPNGFKTNLVFDPDEAPGLYEVLQSYLKGIGIDMELRSYETAVFGTMRTGKKYDQLVSGDNTLNPDPLRFLVRYTDPTSQYGYNWGFDSKGDPVALKMVQDACNEFNDAKRVELIHQANLYMLENAWSIQMPGPMGTFVWQSWLGGYSGEGNLGWQSRGALIARIWVDQAKKKAAGR